MSDKVFKYPALLVRQGPGAPPLALFSASAMEIEQWVGIPQKARVLDGETLGFQRDSNEDRVNQIAQFYSEPRNVIHNPLLCAIRQATGLEVEFAPAGRASASDRPSVPGTLTIKFPDRSIEPLATLFRQARSALENRVPELIGHSSPEALMAKLRAQADTPIPLGEEEEDSDSDFGETDGDTAGNSVTAPEEALFQASNVADFWSELRERELLLERLGDQAPTDLFLGFGREAVEAYLRPVVLVDGQHRLLGALRAVRNVIDHDPTLPAKILKRLSSGTQADEITNALLLERARRLPISLLLDPSPGEHVFQFVVVNQKATPVRPALLATIISTSLSEAELEPITDRLENAGIPLRSSRAISFLTTSPASPFANRVARGLAEEGSDLLPWTVLGQLVTMFRDLKTARYFHDNKIDYADVWKRRLLPASGIVNINGGNGENAYDVWRSPDGPWRAVFIRFWSVIRDSFGDSKNPDARNAWGNPRTSNLFNKPSLMTLATDFFAFLVEARKTIDSAESIDQLVEEWLPEDVDRAYFARDWKLSGVKKDSVGTRKQWSKIWFGYRRDPRALPNIKGFSTLYKET